MRHVLLATVATAGLLVTPGAAAQTPPKTQRATVDATVKLTRVTKARAVGTVRFTGQLRDGTPIRGKGTVIVPGRKTAAGFRDRGLASVIFDGTLRRSVSPVPLRDAVGILRFAGGTTEGTGIFWDDGTLTFLGTSQEGTGI